MSGIFEALLTAAVGVFILAVMDFLFANRRDRWSLRTYLLVVFGFKLAVVLGFMLAAAIGEAVFGPYVAGFGKSAVMLR